MAALATITKTTITSTIIAKVIWWIAAVVGYYNI